jgi:hypothetical protein
MTPGRAGLSYGFGVLAFVATVMNTAMPGWPAWYRLARDGQRTQARVTRTWPSNHQQCDFLFSIGPAQHEGSDGGCPAHVGDVIQVTYSPTDPSFVTVRNPRSELIGEVVGALGVALLVGGVVWWQKRGAQISGRTLQGSVVVALAVLASAGLAVAQGKTDDPRWSPAGRQRVLEITRWLEAHPLEDVDKSKRTEVMKWFVEAPDVSVTWCAGLLIDGSNKKTQMIVMSQGMFGAGAFLVEHPERAADGRAATMAGVASALAAYRRAVAVDRSYVDATLEKLVSGGSAHVEAYVDGRLKACAEDEARRK